MSKEADLIAYCGLDCATCVSHKEEIADLAKALRKKLREEKFDKMAVGMSKYFKALQNYGVCYEVLGAMVRLRCNRSCREGGGNPYCKVRICCKKKELDGCWECAEFETCQKMDFLKPVHEDAHLKNLRKLSKAKS
jgi:hypothetical protein